jgi:hypothetical protein
MPNKKKCINKKIEFLLNKYIFILQFKLLKNFQVIILIIRKLNKNRFWTRPCGIMQPYKN